MIKIETHACLPTYFDLGGYRRQALFPE